MTENNHVAFTEVLYGVVVANAFYQLSFGWTVRNFLLLTALVVVVADWVEYHIGFDLADPTGREYATAFVLDIVILLVWYLMTIVPLAQFRWFLALTALFLFFTGVWDRAVRGKPTSELVRGPDWQLSAAYAGLFVIQSFVYRIPAVVALALVLASFVARKGPAWREMFSESRPASAM